MIRAKADIIQDLKKQIMPLQGFGSAYKKGSIKIDLGPINDAFPDKVFPTGVVHEFCCTDQSGSAATSGFITAIISMLMHDNGVGIWISSSLTIFPPALISFGVDPANLVFIDLKKENDLLWVMEEALKCEGIAAVILESKDISFTVSRRLQLAVEQSGVTGFILRRNSRDPGTTACLTRWKIRSVSGEFHNEMPGVGFPRWKAELLKVRNGKPGSWLIEWSGNKFNSIQDNVAEHELLQEISLRV